MSAGSEAWNVFVSGMSLGIYSRFGHGDAAQWKS